MLVLLIVVLNVPEVVIVGRSVEVIVCVDVNVFWLVEDNVPVAVGIRVLVRVWE